MGVPAFLEGGGGGGVLSASEPIQPVGRGGGGAAVRFRPIQSIRCPRFRQIQPVGGGVRMYVNKGGGVGAIQSRNGGGGGGGGMAPHWGRP